MLRGIDVSHHQQAEDIDWERLKEKDDISFCYIRASYGTRVDSEAIDHAKACQRAGIAYGFYHFFRHHQNVDAQVAAFHDSSGWGDPGLVPVLDLEQNRYDPSVESWAKYTAAAWQVGCRLSSLASFVLYISPAWFANLAGMPPPGEDAWFARFSIPLWIAHWDVAQPRAPRDWQIWQRGVRKFKGAPYELDFNEARELPRIPNVDEPSATDVFYDLKVNDCFYIWPDGSLRLEKWEPTE